MLHLSRMYNIIFAITTNFFHFIIFLLHSEIAPGWENGREIKLFRILKKKYREKVYK